MPKASSDKAPPKRGWLRRVVRGTGWFLLGVVILHRPLVHYGGPLVGRFLAARQNLDARFKLSGTIFTNLRISGINVVPNGGGPTPVEHIRIAELRFDYSIPRLIRGGIGEFMHSYELHHADLSFVALPSNTKEERDRKVTIAQQLNSILAQPAAYADRALINDFSIRVQSPKDETIVGPIHLLLHPTEVGHLRIGVLQAPGVPGWENLEATTTYANRNMFIRGLALGPDILIDELNFDASKRAQNQGTMALTAHLFGGELRLSLAGEELAKAGETLEKSYATRLQVSASGIDVPAAAAYFGVTKPLPIGTLTKLEILFYGEPEMPRTWDGSVALALADASAGPVRIEPIELGMTAKGGQAKLRVAGLVESNRAEISATAALPATIKEFAASDLDATIAVTAPMLQEVGARLNPPVAMSGDVGLQGTISMRARRLAADLQLAVKQFAFQSHAVDDAQITLRGSKLLVDGAPVLTGLAADLDLRLREFRTGTVSIDSARVAASAQEQQITVATLEVLRGDNSVSAKGSYIAPADLQGFEKAAGDAQFAIRVPRLADFGIGSGEKILAGKLEGSGEVRMVNGVPEGSIALDGSGFDFGGAKAERLTTKVRVVGERAVIDELSLRLNEHDGLVITGAVSVEAPFAYEAKVDFGIRNLAVFQATLESFGVKEKVAGAITLSIAGQGAVKPARHSGELTLGVKGVRYGTFDLRELRLAGNYSPEAAQSREFHVASGVTTLDSALAWEAGKLRVQNLVLQQGGQKALTGFITVPFDPARGGQMVAFDEPLEVNLNARDLNLEKLLTSLGQKAPASGAFTLDLLASGTVLAPVLDLKVSARGLKAAVAPKFDAAELKLAVHLAEKQLTLEASLKQPLIQPLTIAGRVPLDVEAIVTKKKLDPAMPLNATVKMPPSSLAVLPKIVPAIRRIEGTAGIDVHVGGTVEKPVFSGKAAVRLKDARMTAPNIPVIGNFTADLAFAGDVLNFETFRGEVGGGKFQLLGKINLAKLTEPVFDLHLKADDVLAMRDDTITLRTDAELKLGGPLNAAAATGTVWITQSRFFKEIDILPIGLPGRPKPAPKSAPRGSKTVSFPNPPLRDMKFDIDIKTRENDPFLIRGNMANGGVNVALHFGGTGLEPWLDGSVQFQDFTASLPFSALTISRGFVYFKKEQPFEATLDLQAESKVREYTVGAYIYGPAKDPQVQFTSEPPLPHADIVSLLATGTTTAELAGSADVLASRAAMLAVQSLYKKMFKKGGRATPPLGGPRKDPGGASWLERFQVELGGIDNRTGGQAATARFKINEQMYLMGELDTQGRYTGAFKYLLRFR